MTFPTVNLVAGQRLHFATGAAGLWNLLDSAGNILANARSQLIPTA